MGSKAAFVVSVLFSVLGCLLLIVSVGSMSWIKGCADLESLANKLMSGGLGDGRQSSSRQTGDLFDFSNLGNQLENTLSSLGNTVLSDLEDKVKDAISNMGQSNPFGDVDLGDEVKNALSNIGQSAPFGDADTSNVVDEAKNVYSSLGQVNPLGMKMCLGRGILMISGEVLGVGLSVAIPVSEIGKGILFGAAASAFAVLCSFAAFIALITAAAANAESYEGKRSAASRARVGIIFLAVAGTFGLAGMIAFTVQNVNDVKKPATFFSQMMSSVVDTMMNQDVPGASSLFDLSGFSKGIGGDFVGQAMSSIFQLHIGYSLYLGWAGVVFVLLAMIVSAVGKQSMISQPYSGPDTVKL